MSRQDRDLERKAILDSSEDHMAGKGAADLDDILYGLELLTRAVCNVGETIEAVAHRKERKR